MERSRVREAAFALIFSMPYHEDFNAAAVCEEGVPLIEGIFGEKISQKNKGYIEGRVSGVFSNLGDIDGKIKAALREDWGIDRINRADLAILRLAAYEIFFDGEVPPPAAINEAVELAKAYGDEGSAKFVNGVLGELMKS
ncbi:MAG: transcription antitermination factor NusB [Clostridiales bacterium]|jgi:N utilization substance protein B|nr:transcription antitermination factor NusB [Clostridiales bacterium]